MHGAETRTRALSLRADTLKRCLYKRRRLSSRESNPQLIRPTGENNPLSHAWFCCCCCYCCCCCFCCLRKHFPPLSLLLTTTTTTMMLMNELVLVHVYVSIAVAVAVAVAVEVTCFVLFYYYWLSRNYGSWCVVDVWCLILECSGDDVTVEEEEVYCTKNDEVRK